MSRYLRDPQFKRADDKVKRRNDWFLAFNREATINGGWVISSPGSAMCIIETLLTSGWPDELRARGFRLAEIEGGQRILPHARFTSRWRSPRTGPWSR